MPFCMADVTSKKSYPCAVDTFATSCLLSGWESNSFMIEDVCLSVKGQMRGDGPWPPRWPLRDDPQGPSRRPQSCASVRRVSSACSFWRGKWYSFSVTKVWPHVEQRY